MIILNANKAREAGLALLVILLVYSVVLSAEASGAGEDWVLNPPEQSWFPKAPALARAEGPMVQVSDARGLIRALEQAEPGQTPPQLGGVAGKAAQSRGAPEAEEHHGHHPGQQSPLVPYRGR